MRVIYIAAGLALVIAVVAFLLMLVLYRGVFCLARNKRPDKRCIPDSQLYHNHYDKMLELVDEMENTVYEEVSISSQDGLLLYGKLYLMKQPGSCDNMPFLIFFHGYHGVAAWDGYGFFKLCKGNGINLLMVDERAHGKSGGSVITFGIRERYDCKLWSEYIAGRFGEDTDIFLAGVSMGASSVIMSTELGLPGNVRAIIADCGYTEPAAIIMETVKAMGFPVKSIYFLLKQGARLFGHFDLESAAPLRAVRKLKIPILFIHGEKDSIVPSVMGEELYKACTGKKEWALIAGADHANSAMTDYEAYEKAILRFME